MKIHQIAEYVIIWYWSFNHPDKPVRNWGSKRATHSATLQSFLHLERLTKAEPPSIARVSYSGVVHMSDLRRISADPHSRWIWEIPRMNCSPGS